jgi:CRISPR-associated protein Cmr6
MIRNLDVWAAQHDIETEPNPKVVSRAENRDELWQQVPKMYQAQIKGRCNLQFAGNNDDLTTWTEEWLYPSNDDPSFDQAADYQIEVEQTAESSHHCVEVEFPFRLFSNCGQDSIARPVMGKNGIPYLPGSSVKGIFRRACTPQEAKQYCGDKEELEPGHSALRFHGAYPAGNWGDRINDVVHPQQQWQVENDQRRSAYAFISLYQPRMVFRFSTAKPEQIDWDKVEAVLKRALEMGVGGKTSTGYGLNGHKLGENSSLPDAAEQFRFQGIGVCSTLRTEIPEFRSNIFKAALRGHIRRLLGGVCNQTSLVNRKTDWLFGHTRSPGVISLIWQSKTIKINSNSTPATYKVDGNLYIKNERSSRPDQADQDLAFLTMCVEFAYIMGGFGKSWRRVWHDTFNPDYKKFAIGCHWSSPNLTSIRSEKELKEFLDKIYQKSKNYIGVAEAQSLPWREAWHPDRLGVYCRVGSESKAIHLFHETLFKETPAIGGRREVEDKRKKGANSKPKKKKEFLVSHVWHRMLPIGTDVSGKEQYLEIVTVFHKYRRDLWQRNGEDQLKPFIDRLTSNSMTLAWGTPPIDSSQL